MIKSILPTDLTREMVEIISRTYQTAGQRAEADDQMFQVQEITADLRERFPALTLDEVRKAFANGVRGVYGTFMGLNVKTYNEWLNAFLMQRKQAKMAPGSIKTIPQNTELSEYERKRISDDQISFAREHFKKHGNFYFYTGIVSLYENMASRGMIEPEAWLNKMQAASERMAEELERQRKAGTLSQFREITAKLESLPKEAEKIKIEAMRIAVEEYCRENI